jgi:hypothetical protein
MTALASLPSAKVHWAVPYVGLKWVLGGRSEEGVDCWGLLQLVYRKEKQISLPDYPGITAQDIHSIARLMDAEAKDDWLESEPFDMAAVAMSQREVVHHVGLCLMSEGKPRILHCWDRMNVVVHTLDQIKLHGIRRVIFYRHRLWPTSS